jgi:phage virion morphogenesis protein
MTGASVRIDGGAALSLFGDLLRRAEDLSGLYAGMAGELELQTRERFETTTGPDGQKWPPSKRAAKGGRTLTDTARLLNSITSASDTTHAEVGTNVVYAAIHQFGGDIEQPARATTLYRHFDAATGKFEPRFLKARNKKANRATTHAIPARTIRVPARPFLGVGPADAAALLDVAAEWLLGAP